jgi:hypothetical protein
VKLPNAENAKVDREKLERYLLSPTHPVGRSKAEFLRSLGFRESDAAQLESALKEMARSQETAAPVPSAYGVKYIVDGLLPTPSGRRVRLRTVWIIDAGENDPRFVTAYPV